MAFPLGALGVAILRGVAISILGDAIGDRIKEIFDQEEKPKQTTEKETAKPVIQPKPFVPARSGVKVSLPNTPPIPKSKEDAPPPVRVVDKALILGPAIPVALTTIWKFVTTAYAGWVAADAVRKVINGLEVEPTVSKADFKFGKLIGHNHVPQERAQVEWLEIVTGEDLVRGHQESFNGFSYWLANQTGKIDDVTYDSENTGDFYDQGALVWPLDPRDFSGGISLMFGAKTVGDVFANYWSRSLNSSQVALRGVTWADVKPLKMAPSWERDYKEKGADSDSNKADGGLATSMVNLIAKGAVINAATTGKTPKPVNRVRLENTNINKTGVKGGLPVCQWPLDRGTVIGSQQAQSAVLDVVTNTQLVAVNAKLGPQVKGGISGWLGNFAKSLYLDKALNFVNVMLNIHNAMMLSRNLVMTLGEVQNLVINAIGKQMKNETLQQFDVNKEVGKAFKGLIESILGKEKTNDLSLRIAKYNRIMSAATNLLNTVESMLFSISEMMSLAGEYQGKVGNALKRSGVILEDSYSAMQEKWQMMTNKRFAKLDKVLRGIEKSTDVADNLSSIAGEAAEIPDHLKELQDGRKEFKKAVVDAVPERSPGNKKIQEKADKEKTASASPEISDADKIKPEVTE